MSDLSLVEERGSAFSPALSDPPQRMLIANNISKSFGATQALNGVSIALEPGEIHGLIGENGAGKSTLVKILCGVYRADEGSLEIAGAPVTHWTPHSAIAHGIVTVHQDVNLIESMTVTENIFLNAEIERGPLLDNGAMRKEAQRLLEQLHLEVSADAVLGTLPTDLRKMVQLARALRQKPHVLLLDEPTSSLTASEVDVLVRQIKSIADSGVSILYISHYLNEVFEHTQGLSVMRNGEAVWQGRTADISMQEAIRIMIGSDLASSVKRQGNRELQKQPVLEVCNLSLGEKLTDVSFSIGPGEILGIGGLIGAGLGELARSVFADPVYRHTDGQIRVDGETVQWSSPADAMRAGVALVTNDRHRTGALVDFSIAENIGLPSLDRFSNSLGVLKSGPMQTDIVQQMSSLSVKAAGPSAALSTLSGGNQQKVMLAKWFMTNPRILILDEPTIGVDIGAKQAIKEIILQKAADGCAVIVLSSEMEELAEIADRAIILFRGRVISRIDTPGFTQADLTRAANASAESADEKI